MSDLTINAQDYLSLAQRINATALDPGGWPGVMAHLSRLADGTHTHLFGYDLLTARSESVFHAHGYDPAFLDSYIAYYGAQNVWAPGFARHAPGVVVPSQVMYAEDALRRTEFYADWVVPQENIIKGGGGVILKDETRAFLIGGNLREKDGDRVQPFWLGLLSRVMGHLQQALEINRTMAGLRLEAHLLRQQVDPDGAAVVVMNRQGRIVSLDANAAAAIEAGRPLRLTPRGRLRLSDLRAQARFEMLLRRQTAGPSAAPSALMLRAEDGRPWRGHVVRLDGAAEAHLQFAQAMFAEPPLTVLVLAPETDRNPPEARLARRLGLTRAEAAVALLLAEGLTPAEIAEMRGTRLVTIRNQIKQALSKTGSRRQADLVRRVLSQGHRTK